MNRVGKIANTLGTMSTSRKLLGGFAGLLLILVLVSGISYYVVQSSAGGFTNYREMARDSNLTARLQANMLMVRMNVKDFIITGSYRDLKQYADYLRRMQGYLEESQLEIQKPERAAQIDEVEEHVKTYVVAFDKVVKLQETRNDKVFKVLDVTGPYMEANLTAIMTSAEESDDMSAAFHSGLTLKHLLLARLYVAKFLVNNDQRSIDRVRKEFDKVDEELQILDKELQNEHRREMRQTVQEKFIEYEQTSSSGMT